MAIAGMGGDRHFDRGGRTLLRGACGDDAERGRSLCLPARGFFAALGVPVRLDALSGHTGGRHRGGRGSLLGISGRDCPGRLFDLVDNRPDKSLDKLRRKPFDAATDRHTFNSRAHAYKHARASYRQDDSKRLHLREDARACRPYHHLLYRAQRQCHRAKLLEPLDIAKPAGGQARHVRHALPCRLRAACTG